MSERDPSAGTPAGPPEQDPRIEGEKHPVAKMIALGIGASLVGIAITLLIDWFPTPASDSAGTIDTVYDVLLICSVPVFVLVMTVAIYSVVRFRAMPGDMRDGAPIHGNTRLEVIWVTIPFLMVTALSIYGWIVLDDLEAKQPDELVVNVTGQQFTWTFEYPQEKVESTELVLPKDRPVEFHIETNDVIHSFWVPEFRLKSDAVPGLITKIRLTPDRLGRYQVVCAELCGIGHAAMRQNVRVVEPGAFDDWLADQEEPAAAQGGGDGGDEAGGGEQAGGEQAGGEQAGGEQAGGEQAGGEQAGGEQAGGEPSGGGAEGEAVFAANGCGSCHTLAAAGASGTIGPDLSQIARADAADAAYIRDSVVDPNKVIAAGYSADVMPDDFRDKLSPAELDALVEYLLKAQK
jgi:cytochrome c oxidase subunit 2